MLLRKLDIDRRIDTLDKIQGIYKDNIRTYNPYKKKKKKIFMILGKT